MSTQVLTANFNSQAIVWAGADALWAMLCTLALLLVGCAMLATVFVLAVVFWLPLVQLTASTGVIALFAVATYPRKAVRNGR